MTKEIKDMTQEELRKMFAEKNTELYQLAKKVDEETDADILVFSLIGVNKEERTLSSNVVYGRSIGLANLLMEEEEYHESHYTNYKTLSKILMSKTRRVSDYETT